MMVAATAMNGALLDTVMQVVQALRPIAEIPSLMRKPEKSVMTLVQAQYAIMASLNVNFVTKAADILRVRPLTVGMGRLIRQQGKLVTMGMQKLSPVRMGLLTAQFAIANVNLSASLAVSAVMGLSSCQMENSAMVTLSSRQVRTQMLIGSQIPSKMKLHVTGI